MGRVSIESWVRCCCVSVRTKCPKRRSSSKPNPFLFTYPRGVGVHVQLNPLGARGGGEQQQQQHQQDRERQQQRQGQEASLSWPWPPPRVLLLLVVVLVLVVPSSMSPNLLQSWRCCCCCCCCCCGVCCWWSATAWGAVVAAAVAAVVGTARRWFGFQAATAYHHGCLLCGVVWCVCLCVRESGEVVVRRSIEKRRRGKRREARVRNAREIPEIIRLRLFPPPFDPFPWRRLRAGVGRRGAIAGEGGACVSFCV
jgi:hypothetical protein